MLKLDKNNIEDIIALTPMQEGMLFHYLKNPESSLYFEQLNLHISGEIDSQLFKKAWNLVIENNEMLRTVFRWENVENPVQIILKEHKLQPGYYELPGRDVGEKNKRLEEIRDRDRGKKFNLEEVPFRVTLCKVGEDKYEMIISNHHILYDGWSNGIILKEFFNACNDLTNGNEFAKPVKTRFKEFVKWIRNLHMDTDKQEKFWTNYLKGIDSPAELSIKRKRKGKGITGTEKYQIKFEKEIAFKLGEGVKRHKYTLASCLYCAWGLLLQRYNNTDDVIFGTTVSGRAVKVKAIEEIVGLFINTIPLRVHTLPNEKIEDLLYRIHHELQMREEYEHTSLVNIKEFSEIGNNEEFFDSIVIIENYPLHSRLMLENSKLSVESYSLVEMTHYDLTVEITIFGDIELNFIYNKDLFDGDTIVRLYNHFRCIVEDFIKNPGKRVLEVDITLEAEKNKLLYQFNNTDVDYPKEKTIHKLFEEQVKRKVDNIAVIGGDQFVPTGSTEGKAVKTTGRFIASISYGQLDRVSNQLAYRLKEKGVQSDNIVGIMVGRSVGMIIGILGILKAGGAYLPIDPGYPGKRINYLLSDSQAKILLTTKNIAKVINFDKEMIYLNYSLPRASLNLSEGDLSNSHHSSKNRINYHSKNLVYAIYTSGSTGKPKGVLIEHRSLVNRLNWMQRYYPIREDDVILQKTPFTFDVSVWELFWWFFQGASLSFLGHGDEKSPGAIIEAIEREKVTTIHFVPSMLNAFLEYLENLENLRVLPTLKQVFASGEALAVNHVERFNRLFKQRNEIKLINLYGPTEATVDVSFFNCPVKEKIEKVPIGKPIDNIHLYVVTKSMALQPVGVAGELCISGHGLARGYLNNPELTKEKFAVSSYDKFSKVTNDQCPMTNDRLYRTGDLARWLPDGNIEFLGRADHQLKIRGFRIELEEIENQLICHDAVKEAVVTVGRDKTGDKYLGAYFVANYPGPADKIAPLSLELKNYLSGILPSYMLPSYFVQMEKIPLTPNGKVNRKALPGPELRVGEKYTAPRDKIEEKLVRLWASILGIEKDLIGIEANFFELGGHSLKAISLASRIQKEFNVKVTLGEIFNRPTIQGIAGFLECAAANKPAALEVVEKKDYYPLSSAQKRLYVLHRLEEDNISYNMPQAFALAGELEMNKLVKASCELIKRHESLRTSFLLIDGEPVQKVLKPDKVNFAITHRSAWCEGEVPLEKFCEPKNRWRTGRFVEVAKIMKHFVRPFDLSQAPLLRMGLVKIKEKQYIFMVDMHHIISDGFSLELIVHDFLHFFGGKELPPLDFQYKDFIQWQNRLSVSGHMKKQEKYWLKTFDGEIPVLQLPMDYDRPLEPPVEGNRIHFDIPVEETGVLKKLALMEGTTMFMVLLAIYNIFLSKLGGLDDIIIGTPTAGRRNEDLEKIVGVFINTLALRNYPQGDKTFNTFLAEIKENSLKAFENQDYQFEDLVNKVASDRNISRNPLFDVMFVWEYRDGLELELPGMNMSPYIYENRTSKFDLTLMVKETGDKLACSFIYWEKVFLEKTIKRFVTYIKQVVDSILVNPVKKIYYIEMIPIEEKRRLLCYFSAGKADYPNDKTIRLLFEEQVNLTSGNKAVVFRNPQPGGSSSPGYRTLSYRELDKRANQLSMTLIRKGVGLGTIVGIMMEPSLEMIVGIFAILKAGGGYLPLEPESPGDRIIYMLNDSSTKILLTQKHLVGKVKFDGETINCEDTSIYGGEGSNVRNFGDPGDLLYVIYTSGTSGKPKGVPITNENMVNYMNWVIKAIDLTVDDKSILTSSFAFDLLYTVIFGTILTGGELHVPPRETFLVPGNLLNYTRENKITFMKVTPSLFNLIVNCIDFSLEMCRTLRFIMLGGEMIVVKDVEKAHKVCRHLRVMNHYGPTETTIGSVVQMIDFDKFEEYKINPTIGKPIDNYRVYIVDRYCRLVPVGVCGELCIGGSGVGLGYLNRPELTSDRFIKNHYRKGGRLYRTGDLAKWLLDGNIKLLGRLDDQVKIRGYRIELEEIKIRLLKHKDIKDAVVIGRQAENGDKYLCAYIVSDKKLPTSQLREYLSRKLPDHMIPLYFVQMDQIPMAKQNKVDRKMLPAPVFTTEKGYIPPRNAAEKKLVETWEHILGKTPIGIDENFFINGGDSIKTIQVISRMNKTGYELKMKDIFQHPTIAELAPFVKRFERAADQSVISGTIPLTPIQEEFFTGPGTDRHHYNQTVLFHAKERLEEEGIRCVFQKIQEHHDALRMTFKEVDGEIIQTNHELGYPLSLDVYDFRNREEEDAKEALEGKAGDIQGSIDLEKGPLVKVGLFRLVDGDRLLIVSHHLVIDTVSWRILLEDIERLYRRYQKGGSLELPPKTDSFKLWAEKLSNYADSEEFLKEKSYWRKLESTQIPGIEKEFNEEDNYLKDCDTISIDISEEKTAALLTGVNAAFSTGINDILLTDLCLVVRETFGIDRLSIALEGHGREEIIPDVDISRTVGWFTSLYPVILEVVPGDDLGRQIKEIKERLRQVPNKGIGYGILKYLTHDEHKKDMVFQLAPQISFNYLGQFDAGPDTMLLGRAKESTGHSRSPDGQRKYRWDILSLVIDNTMEISVTYNKKQYKRETLSRFLAHYKDQLEKITVFCLAREKGEPTPSDFSYKGLSIDTVDRLCRQYPVQDIYALTPTQAGMLFHEQYETSSAYFVQVSFRFQGRLSIPLLEKSLNQLFKRYDILRTAFVYEGLDEPVQVVLEERRVDFLYRDIRGIAPGIEKETFIKEFKESDLERSFNLSRDVLLRMAVLRVEDGVYEFIWSNHHILMDGWCRALLNTELFEIYNGYLQKKPFQLPPVKPYRSYIQWLEKQDKEKARKYWGNLLEGYNGTAVVPRRNVPGTVHEGEGYKREEITFVLDSARTKALNGLATQNRVTLSVIIQTLWGLLLANYNGKNDVVFGIVVSGRPSEIDGVESMVGLFINTIPVRIRFKESAKFSDLIRQVQEESIKGAAYQYFSLADIQAQTVLKQNLLDHFLTFLNYPIGELNERGIIGKNKEPASGSLAISNIGSVERSNYNLDVLISYDEQLNVLLRYNAIIYDDKFMKKLLVHIDEVIAQVIGNNDIELKDISISHGLVVAEPSMEREDQGDFAF